MGKGTIVNHIEGGLYNITINYNRTYYEKRLLKLEKRLAEAIEKYDQTPGNSPDYSWTQAMVASYRFAINFLNAKMIEDNSLQAWCADLTEDLTGEVATVEVNGQTDDIQIVPGFSDQAVYSSENDGQLTPTSTISAAATFYNLAIFPGWQKWKPTYRYGSVTSISGDICDISLTTATSSAQNLNINQTDTLSNVAIEYMDCNGEVFSEDDIVLIEFTDQDWKKPKVVGFKDNPKDCSPEYLCVYASGPVDGATVVLRLIWDVEASAPAVIENDVGVMVSGAQNQDDISTWLSEHSVIQVGSSGLGTFTGIYDRSDSRDSWTDPGGCPGLGSEAVSYGVTTIDVHSTTSFPGVIQYKEGSTVFYTIDCYLDYIYSYSAETAAWSGGGWYLTEITKSYTWQTPLGEYILGTFQRVATTSASMCSTQPGVVSDSERSLDNRSSRATVTIGNKVFAQLFKFYGTDKMVVDGTTTWSKPLCVFLASASYSTDALSQSPAAQVRDNALESAITAMIEPFGDSYKQYSFPGIEVRG